MALQKVVDIDLGGRSFRLAENGTHFHLTRKAEAPDPFGVVYHVAVSPEEYIGTSPAAVNVNTQALIDALGIAHKENMAWRLELERAHGALQREAGGPDGPVKPRAAREGGTMATGVLEEKP